MKFLECLFSKNNLWTLAKVSGLWPPLAWTLCWSLGLGFGVWGSVFSSGRPCVLHAPWGCSQGMFRVVSVFQDPAVISCCLCSQCCCHFSGVCWNWLGAKPHCCSHSTPALLAVGYSAKHEAPFNYKCLKLSRNQFPLVRK